MEHATQLHYAGTMVAALNASMVAAGIFALVAAGAIGAAVWQQRRLVKLRGEYKKLRSDFTQANERAAGSRAEKAQVLRIALQNVADPVKTLKHQVETVLAEETFSPPVVGRLHQIYQQASRISGALGALDELQSLDNRARSLLLVPVNVGAILIEAATQCSATASEKQIRVSPPDPSKSWQVLADPAVLRKVLENLLVDAIEVTPPRGTITLSIYQATDRVLMAVSDEGPGTTVSDQASLLDQSAGSRPPFSAGGARLNLAMVHNLVKAMDGWFWSQGEPGGGTTHVVELPLLEPRRNRTFATRGALEPVR